jgi:rRNA maturation protein Rpf1
MMTSERTPPIGVVITTSRNPNHFLRRAAKILSFSIPNSQKLNRGTLNLKQLYNFCWNHKIPRLIILQRNKKDKIINFQIYSIEKEIQAINVDIQLFDLIELHKHDAKTRIMVDKVKLEFSNEIHPQIKKRLIKIFNPLFNFSRLNTARKRLIVNFKPETADILIGTAVQKYSSISLRLYTLRVTFGDRNE